MAMYTGNQTEAVAEKNYLSGAGAIGRSYAVDQLVPPPPVSAITEAHRTFEEARILANRVKEIVGRIVGYVPEDPTKCGLASDAIFDNLKSVSADTRQAINEALQAITRLENQLP